MTTHSPEYRAYLQSPQWQVKRWSTLALARQRCERCKRYGVVLQVHHKTYERLGHESPADLEVLCTDCHARADMERREQSARQRAFAWAARIHGQYWRDTLDEDDVVDEFEDWLERKGA